MKSNIKTIDVHFTSSNTGTVVQIGAAKVTTASIFVSKIDFGLVSWAIESVQERQNDNINRTVLTIRSQALKRKLIVKMESLI